MDRRAGPSRGPTPRRSENSSDSKVRTAESGLAEGVRPDNDSGTPLRELAGRGPTVLAIVAFLALPGLTVLVYLRVVRPLARGRRGRVP